MTDGRPTRQRAYRVSYVYRTWKREPRSPFATASVVYRDPSVAHEEAMRLRERGHHNVRIEPFDLTDENG